jgi:hypothetical protein
LNKTSQAASDQDIALLRQDIRSKKKQLIAINLSLSDADAAKFWPVYDRYTGELSKIDDSKYAAIKEYAQNWGSVTDEAPLAVPHRAWTLTCQSRNCVGNICRSFRPCFQARSWPPSFNSTGV